MRKILREDSEREKKKSERRKYRKEKRGVEGEKQEFGDGRRRDLSA